MTETAEQICTHCNETCPVDANWCEACGNDLDAPAAAVKNPCVSCAAAGVEITDDGWCQMCGTKQPAPEDHVVADHGWFAMVSDRGRVHRSNEDTGGVVARPTGVALVVCDGVSSTDESQHASQNAVRTILDVVATAKPGDLDPNPIDAAIVQAATAAQAEILRVTTRGSGEPPSCTMVTVVVDTDGGQADVRLGWLGDSRAYWIADGTATQLTRDHSWAREQHDLGELDEATIEADSRAHSITRWLGADSHDVTPELTSLQVHLPGLLLVCSDGLWNYAPTETEMYDVVYATGVDADETPLQRSERLVSFANEQGGHDNITVAIAELTAPHSDPANPAQVPDQTNPDQTSPDPQE